MKKYPVLILVLTITFAALLFFSYQYQRKSNVKVIMAFHAGTKFQQLNLNEKKFCAFFEESFQFFCHEGFSASILNNESGSVAMNVKKWNETYSLPSQPQLIGAGMGLGAIVKEISQLQTHLNTSFASSTEDQKAFLVDGWAFAQSIYHHKKLDQFLKNCREFSDQAFISACQFGAGRSRYFLNSQFLDNEFSPTELPFQYGIGFAMGFAGQLRENDVQNIEFKKGISLAIDARVAQKKLASLTPAQKCLLEGKHFTKCIH